MTVLAHRIQLQPRPKQATWLVEQAGYERWAWNRMLALFKQGLDNGIWWDEASLRRDCRRLRPDRAAGRWLKGSDMAGRSLYRAIRAWRSKTNPSRFPRFHRRKHGISVTFEGVPFSTEGRRVRLPGLGSVRLREPLRLTGRLLKAVITEQNGRWWIAMTVDTRTVPARTREGVVRGVDVGVRTLAVTSDGLEFPNPKPLASSLDALRQVNRAISRSINVHGRRTSNRRLKLYRQRARLYERIANIRRDAHRQAAVTIVRGAKAIVVEDLNVAGMVRNRRLARAISDTGISAFLREIAWQCEKQGVRLFQAGRWFPSSRRCSECGAVKARLALSERGYACGECGAVMDRDLNAARNLRAVAVSAVHGETVSPAFAGSVSEKCESIEGRLRPAV